LLLDGAGSAKDATPRTTLPTTDEPSSRHAGRRWATSGTCLVVAIMAAVAAVIGLVPGARGRARGAASPRDFLARAEAAPATTSAWELLGSSELHAVAADNLIRTGRPFAEAADRDAVQEIVSQVFVNLTEGLSQRAPSLADALRAVGLGTSEQAALLDALRLLSNSEVRRVGLSVAEAVRGSGSKEQGDILQHIGAQLRGKREELRRLRSRLLPPLLQPSTAGPDSAALLTLDAESLRVLATVDGSWVQDEEEEADPPNDAGVPDWYRSLPQLPSEDDYRRRLNWDYDRSSRNPFWRVSSFQAEGGDHTKSIPDAVPEQGMEGIQEGVLEQGRVLLDLLLHLPSEERAAPHRGSADATTSEAARALGDAPLERALGSDAAEQVSCGAGTRHAAACLLKLGAQGLGALCFA